MSKAPRKGPRAKKARTTTVADLASAMEKIAPTALAQEWDNVGLLAGDFRAPLTRALLTIDLTAAVVDEAQKLKCELVLAYHPPIFKPIKALRSPATDMSGLVFDCIRSGIAIYATHTALDAADGGTNDVLARLCGAERTEPLVVVDQPEETKCKFVVFVPHTHVDAVAESLFTAGAGRIGNYTHCSFRLDGEGTFYGTEATNPSIGKRGKLERVNEVRLESVVPVRSLLDVVEAMRRTHPYEEPAFDVYPLQSPPLGGLGRTATLPAATELRRLATTLQRASGATQVSIVGPANTKISRAILVAGAAGSLPFQTDLTPQDVIITGEIRHHDALTIQRRGCSAIALGHWASERPVLEPLAERLKAALSVGFRVSQADADPFHAL
jgi:dinuclear metal center YbgI/SA1388 family protein